MQEERLNRDQARRLYLEGRISLNEMHGLVRSYHEDNDSLCRLFGLDPKQTLSVDIHIRPGKPVEATAVVRGEYPTPLLTKRFKECD